MKHPVLTILFQDACIVVIDKPHGLLSVPGKGPDNQDCVSSRVQSIIADARVVHRFDCHTSGVMLMARGKHNQANLSHQFHDRLTQKQYLAVVEGRPAQGFGEIDQPLRGDLDDRPRQIIDPLHGKQALTCWKLLATHNGCSRLLLQPITGRSHQLRVHCAFMGMPIVGDRLYGTAAAMQQPRMLLHAEKLGFCHPETGEKMMMTSECEF